MARYLTPLILFAILVPVLIVGLTRDPTRLPSPLIGNPMPQFDLPSLGDAAARVGSADLNGKVALVNVWATWCVGCREEHDFLMRLAANEVIPIYGLNWRDDRSDALRWLAQLGDPYVATAFDGDGRVGIDWGVYGAPETFLIAANGTVIYKHLGPLNDAIWERDFKPRIEAQGGAS